MGMSINSGRGTSIREAVLALYHRSPDAVLTCREIFDSVDTVEHRTDMADVLRQMVATGDLELGEDRQPGEPGGMPKGAGARQVKSYRLPTMTTEECKKLESVLAAEIDPPTDDPLLTVIDQLPLARVVPDGIQRAARLRRLAGRFEVSAPSLAAELYENATIFEGLAA